MCGIAGFLGSVPADPRGYEGLARRMGDALIHRGPDDSGVWVDPEAGAGLAHRRLSILDLSPAGHQPMISAGGRFVIVFNGEIYNHAELRRELEDVPLRACLQPRPLPHDSGAAHKWRGHSDTETLLAAIERWGMDGTLRRAVGMFAFALWDRKERVLTLARDRLGEKPLYYGWQSGVFLFGSELKALKTHPAFRAEIDRGAVALFLRYSYIPAPYSVYKGIHKLPAGTYLCVRREGFTHATSATETDAPTVYWSARETAAAGLRQRLSGSDAEAIDELERLLRQSVSGQMIADVPLGAFLSGGVDSSTVVALMQAQSSLPVKTFSIGFREKAYNEAEYAKAVARHLGTDHTELYVTPEDTLEVVPRLPAIWEEPFSDPSQIPTFLVSQLTRRHVTVSLSGDGGDELFGGYNRYFELRRIWNQLRRVPLPLRRAAASAITSISPAALTHAVAPLLRLAPQHLQYENPGDKLHKLAEAISLASPEAIYLFGLISHWKDPGAVVIGGTEPETLVTDKARWPEIADYTERMMWLDLVTYLPDDILVKVDRAAMAVSLETRVPFLDHRLIEFAWRLPLSLKIRNGEGKWILRQVLYRHVPRELVDRPKMGFGVPIDTWLRGPLKEWASTLLQPDRLKGEGFLRPEPILEKWREHLDGRRNWSYYLWDVLMFQAWLEQQGRC